MADFAVSQRLAVITSGNNATDNTLTLGSFGQSTNMLATVKVVAGPIKFALNGTSTSGASIAGAASLEIPFRDGDVIHFTQTANGDSFILTIRDLR